MNGQARGTAEMAAAMTIAGTIGWFVVVSGRPVLDIVFGDAWWLPRRCSSCARPWACCAVG